MTRMQLAVPVLALGAIAPLAQAGEWTPLRNQPTFMNPPGLCAVYANANCAPSGQLSFGSILNVTLLTDGGVLVEAATTDDKYDYTFAEYKLVPDRNGSYVNGTWTAVASLPNAVTPANPNGWGPDGLASAVLPDGRVIYVGGEYSGTFEFALSGNGALYDPVANSWRVVPPPPFANLYPAKPPCNLPGFNSVYPCPRYPSPFTSRLVHAIGDAQSVVLADGTFMLASKLSRQQALLDPKTLTWTLTGAGKADVNAEEGWTLLPDGKVLAVDTDLDYQFGLTPTLKTLGSAELYDPATGTWSSTGSTVNRLSGFPDSELGPAVLMANGLVFAAGAEGRNALFNPTTGRWSAGPSFPSVMVKGESLQLVASDTGAALLPNGNVLIAANTYGEFPPTRFFEFDGERLIEAPATPNANLVSGAYFLILPSGQILEFDNTTDVEIYTPAPATGPHPSYAPFGIVVDRDLHRGRTYTLSGRLLNGMSQGAMQGDDLQMATNYPLVRITNAVSHHVVYARTHDFSSMAVANRGRTTAAFDVPLTLETGASELEVVTNGIASAALHVNVQ